MSNAHTVTDVQGRAHLEFDRLTNGEVKVRLVKYTGGQPNRSIAVWMQHREIAELHDWLDAEYFRERQATL